MGVITLLIMMLSLPGIISQFYKEIFNEKGRFKGTMTCPCCGSKADIEIEEVK